MSSYSYKRQAPMNSTQTHQTKTNQNKPGEALNIQKKSGEDSQELSEYSGLKPGAIMENIQRSINSGNYPFPPAPVEPKIKLVAHSEPTLQQIPSIQPKLTIGAPGDQYEQEADHVASQVVQRINAPAPPPDDDDEQPIQRKTLLTMPREDEFSNQELHPKIPLTMPNIQPHFESNLNNARMGGSPLDNAFRAKIEPAMGADFSSVRVHTDSTADDLSQSIQAKAFTTGEDIFFRQGTYDPNSQGGQQLLAHELTHVVQQNRNTVNSNYIQRVEKTEDPSKLLSLYKIVKPPLTIYVTNKEGTIQYDRPDTPKTEKIGSGETKVNVAEIKTLNEGVLQGQYFFTRVIQSDSTAVYGYAKSTDLTPLGIYRDFYNMETDPSNPKQGKILPEDGDPAISQDDVYQSAINDCYLEASLIAIVNSDPSAILALFPSGGLFTSRIENSFPITFPGIPGKEEYPSVTINVSTKLFFDSNGEPLYGGKKNSYLWPAFIQKAWAVYQGSYFNIEMGKPDEIIQMITGSLSTNDDPGNFDSAKGISDDLKKVNKAWDIYKKIVECLNQGIPITLTTEHWEEWERLVFTKERYGLGLWHSHAIIGINDKGKKEDPHNPNKKPTSIKLYVRDPQTKTGHIEVPLDYILHENRLIKLAFGKIFEEEKGSTDLAM